MRQAVSHLYAALGDSTGVGVGARDGRGYVARLHDHLQASRPDARLLNACVSGATSRDLVARQLPRVLAAGPTLVTVFIGINDLIRGVPLSAYARSLEEVASALSTHRARALFCTVPNLSHAPAAQQFMHALGVQRALFEARTLDYNAVVLESARSHGHAAHDLYAVSLQDKAHFFSSDGFHPSDQGYQALADELWPAFEELASHDPAP